jgi:hypothetical protein
MGIEQNLPDQLGRHWVRRLWAALTQVGAVLSMPVSDREPPWFTVLTGTQRACRPICLGLIAGHVCHCLSMSLYISHTEVDDALVATA